MKKVLIVSYHYPPRPGIGTNRISGLTKYLKKFGWEPVVLTTEIEEGEWAPYAKVIQTEFCSSVDRVKRLFRLKPGKGLQQQLGISEKQHHKGAFTCIINLIKEAVAYPDEFCTWIKEASKVGIEIVEKEKISVVLSSSGPVSTHLIARNISRKKKIPWIADYRDLWTQGHYYEHTNLRKIFERRCELRTLKNASALVTVSPPYAEKLRFLHENKEVLCITNGFDPEEVREEEYKNEKFVITHTGSLYDLKKNPESLLVVLKELIDNGFMDERKVHLDFYGPYCYKLQKIIEKYGLEGKVSQNGMVGRAVSLERQRKSSVLLIMEWDYPGEEGVYTGKIFEYLAAKRPILVIGGRGGVLKELIDETGTGFYVPAGKDLKGVVMQLYEEFISFGQPIYTGNWEEISKYSHVNMAEKFARLLEERGIAGNEK